MSGLNPLSEKQIGDFLNDYPQWQKLSPCQDGVSAALYRMYQFLTFEQAIAFIQQVSESLVIPANHHPRWQNDYRTLEIWLSTSELSGRISQRDCDLATQIEQLWVTIET